MNIAALQTFLAVVQAGNLNKAAEQLNVTQSTVTTRLDVLEQTRLGRRLLVRSRRGTELTKAGFVFQQPRRVGGPGLGTGPQGRGSAQGVFRACSALPAISTCGTEPAPTWLENTSGKHQPDLALEAWSGDVSDIGRWLSSGLVDLALVPEPLGGPGLASHEFGRDRLVQVSTVPRAAVAWDPDYVYVDLGSEFRRRHTLAWPVDETAHMTFGSSRWALDYLLDKGGSAYLPWRLAEPWVGKGRLHPVDGAPEFTRSLHMTWRNASLATHPWIDEAVRRPSPDA